MNETQHIFLSPHYDDAALSCGGLIAQLSAAGEPAVVATLFGGKPDYDQLSPFARMIHGRPLASEDPIDQRRAEERHALALLGAESRQGDYLDCIYRQDATQTRWLYASEAALFGPVDPADDALVDELAHCLAALAPLPDQCDALRAAGHRQPRGPPDRPAQRRHPAEPRLRRALLRGLPLHRARPGRVGARAWPAWQSATAGSPT